MAVLVVYDISDEISFENVRKWLFHVNTHCEDATRILIGNKSDVGPKRRVIDETRGQALADECGMSFMETSAKSGSNLQELFMSIAKEACPLKSPDKPVGSFSVTPPSRAQCILCC